ncbi:MAG TPA: CopD family protein [Edaphobacter sp.]
MDKLFLLRVLASAVYNLAYSGAWGALLAGWWLAYKAPWELRLIRLLRGLAVALVCALAAQSWLLTASLSGESGFAAVCGLMRQAVFETQPGHVWAAQFLLVVVIAATLFVLRGLTKRSSSLLVIAFALLAAFRAASGHAASYGNLTVQEAGQWVHLLSMAVWSGGVLVSGLLVMNEAVTLEVQEYGLKLSKGATIALAGVILSGIYNAYLGLGGSVAPLTRSQWGGTLIVKLILVLTALALGGWNRSRLRRGAWDEESEKGFIRSLRMEAVVMILILIASAWLANSPPAGEM